MGPDTTAVRLGPSLGGSRSAPCTPSPRLVPTPPPMLEKSVRGAQVRGSTGTCETMLGSPPWSRSPPGCWFRWASPRASWARSSASGAASSWSRSSRWPSASPSASAIAASLDLGHRHGLGLRDGQPRTAGSSTCGSAWPWRSPPASEVSSGGITSALLTHRQLFLGFGLTLCAMGIVMAARAGRRNVIADTSLDPGWLGGRLEEAGRTYVYRVKRLPLALVRLARRGRDLGPPGRRWRDHQGSGPELLLRHPHPRRRRPRAPS